MMKRKYLTQKNTLLQVTQAKAKTKTCKRVFFSPAQEEFYFFSPTLRCFNFFCNLTTNDRQTIRNFIADLNWAVQHDTDDRSTNR